MRRKRQMKEPVVFRKGNCSISCLTYESAQEMAKADGWIANRHFSIRDVVNFKHQNTRRKKNNECKKERNG